jgi:GntR family transcriptional regulator
MELHGLLYRYRIDPCFPCSATFDHVTIDLDQPMPPYRQLAAILRDKIASGELSGRLPSEKSLMQEYGLALGTVRKSIALLRDERLVETTPGWGSYVVDRSR